MNGIKLVFQNGIEYQFLEAWDDKQDVPKINIAQIDTSKEVRYVSMLISTGALYYGLRFYDDKGEKFFDVKFSDKEEEDRLNWS